MSFPSSCLTLKTFDYSTESHGMGAKTTIKQGKDPTCPCGSCAQIQLYGYKKR